MMTIVKVVEVKGTYNARYLCFRQMCEKLKQQPELKMKAEERPYFRLYNDKFEIFVLSDKTYEKWCVGRTYYLLLGKKLYLYRSGDFFPRIRGDEE